jgi:hypothetical protein
VFAKQFSAALFGAVVLTATAAQAQHATSGFVDPMPEPIRRGGEIRVIEQYIAKETQPGSCLVGTFMSADMMALGVPGIRVSPHAIFYPHHGRKHPGASPWRISRSVDNYILSRIGSPALADDIEVQFAKYRPTTEYHFYYKGSDLIARFGFRPC